MRCEISGSGSGSTLEATSLQKGSTLNTVFCQCSIVHPSSSGGFQTFATTPSSPLTCSLIAKRCQ